MFEALTKYAVFQGRARRQEYWLFYLLYLILGIIAAVIEGASGAGLISGLLALVMLLPSISVLVRRLHDTDRSGWWALLMLLPILGGLVLLIFCVLKGTDGPNRFGEDPLKPKISENRDEVTF